MDLLFPFSDYWWLYAGFTAFVLLMLALDLGVFHRKPHALSFREAAGWSVFWISLALGFPFPLGLDRFQKEGAGLLPWAWALNGAFSVVATPLANLLGHGAGLSWLLAAAIVCYLGAGIAWPKERP